MAPKERSQRFLPLVKEGSTIAVWFSCGAASAVAAKMTVDLLGGTCDVRVLNNPVAEEHPDNRRFLSDVEDWIGIRVEIVRSKKWPTASARDVWEKERWMGGVAGAGCTTELKKKPRQAWEALNLFNFDAGNWIVMGFTADEVARHDRFALTERPNLWPVLIAMGVTKKDCWKILADAGIRLPAPYVQGFANSNCIGCVKSSGVTYWNMVRRLYPEVFADRARQSRAIGAKLVEFKGRRIFLDELPPGAVGGRLRGVSGECGVFCEEGGVS